MLTHHGEKTGIFQGEIKLQTSQGKQREKLYGKERHHLCHAHARECSPQKISDNCQEIENYLCSVCSYRECFWCRVSARRFEYGWLSGAYLYSFRKTEQLDSLGFFISQVNSADRESPLFVTSTGFLEWGYLTSSCDMTHSMPSSPCSSHPGKQRVYARLSMSCSLARRVQTLLFSPCYLLFWFTVQKQPFIIIHDIYSYSRW